MPLESADHLMYVPAHINGHRLRLLVDTGSERTTLTEAAAARLRLPHIVQYVTRTFGVAGMSASRDLAVPGIDLGGAHFPVDRVAVGRFALDHFSGPRIDGLLGADILLAFDMDIDLPAHQLTLYQVRDCPDARPPWRQPAMEITGLGRSRDLMVVAFDLDGEHGTAILDTGAQLDVVRASFARRTGLSPAKMRSDPLIRMYGASPGMIRVRLHRFHELRVGPVAIHHPQIEVVPDTSLEADALLGEEFLRGHRGWLSVATDHLFVSGPKTANRVRRVR
jgi:predicted aspartyl protease